MPGPSNQFGEKGRGHQALQLQSRAGKRCSDVPIAWPLKARSQDHFVLSSSVTNQRHFIVNDFGSNHIFPRPCLPRRTLEQMFRAGQAGPQAPEPSCRPEEAWHQPQDTHGNGPFIPANAGSWERPRPLEERRQHSPGQGCQAEMEPHTPLEVVPEFIRPTG